jgi:hypothetical protein
MKNALLNSIPNLKPFNHDLHLNSVFIGKHWVLVNGLSEKKSVYVFEDDNILKISEAESVSKTSWNIDIKDVFSIETEDGLITVKAYFKDDDVLVLDHQDKPDFALFINESNYEEELNTVGDVRKFLRDKYKQKVTRLIYAHKFYYIENFKEFGPFTVEELSEKVKAENISAYCFVRDINEADYSNRLRIWDLIKELG